MYSNLFVIQCLLKNWLKVFSFAAKYKQQYKFTTLFTDLFKWMKCMVVKQNYPIVSIKSFTKPNINLCIEERLTIKKGLRDKKITLTKANLEVYGAFRHKKQFLLILTKNWWTCWRENIKDHLIQNKHIPQNLLILWKNE